MIDREAFMRKIGIMPREEEKPIEIKEDKVEEKKEEKKEKKSIFKKKKK